jgi:hypothetical protein
MIQDTIRALCKDVKSSCRPRRDRRAGTRRKLPSERMPARPYAIVIVLLPDSTIASAYKDVDTEVAGALIAPGNGGW